MQAQRQACSVKMITTLQSMSDMILDWAKKKCKVDKSSKLVSALASTHCGVLPVLFVSTGSIYSQRMIVTAHIAIISHARSLPRKSGFSRSASPAVTDMQSVPPSFFT